MNFFKNTAAAASLAVLGSVAASFTPTAANADATVTVCINGNDCATDSITLGRGDYVSACVDGEVVGKRISNNQGSPSFNDALQVLWSIAAHTANNVTARGQNVTGVQASMEGCTGSWARHCTTVTRGSIPTLGDRERNPNGIISELTHQQPRSCGFFQGPSLPLLQPGQGLR